MTNVRTTNRTEARPFVKPIKLFYNFTVPIPTLTSSYVYIYPARERAGRVMAMDALAIAPAGATAGLHSFLFDDGALLRYLEGVSFFGSALLFDWGYWFTADNAQHPPSATTQGRAVSLMTFSYTQVLRVSYKNSTDVAQVTAPNVGLLYLEMSQ